MAIIYSQQDVSIIKSSTSNFADARDATTGTALNETATSDTQAVNAQRTAGRGGNLWTFRRVFFRFDTSAISAVDTATLNIRGTGAGNAHFFVVKGTQGDTLTTADFDAIDGWSAGDDNSSNVTKYSDEVTSWNTTAYNEITLNSTALSDIVSDDNLYLCCIEADYDLVNNDPGANFQARSGMFFEDYTGTSRDPYIEYTLSLVGYGNNVLGVASGNIARVNGVATANISKVNGV